MQRQYNVISLGLHSLAPTEASVRKRMKLGVLSIPVRRRSGSSIPRGIENVYET